MNREHRFWHEKFLLLKHVIIISLNTLRTFAFTGSEEKAELRKTLRHICLSYNGRHILRPSPTCKQSVSKITSSSASSSVCASTIKIYLLKFGLFSLQLWTDVPYGTGIALTTSYAVIRKPISARPLRRAWGVNRIPNQKVNSRRTSTEYVDFALWLVAFHR